MTSVQIKEQIHSISVAPSHSEKQILAARGFMDLFQFSRVGLYFYSTLSKIGEGIIRIDQEGVSSLEDWRDDVRNLPPIYSAIQARTPKHIDSHLIQQFPTKYTNDFDTEILHTEILVVPICYNSYVVGYACMGSTDTFTVKDNLLLLLGEYGEHLGQVFGNDDFINNPQKLSRREIEVLQKMSWGESTKEMALSLGISHYTVQDYVRSAVQKLNARNRVQGVAEALRIGVIQ